MRPSSRRLFAASLVLLVTCAGVAGAVAGTPADLQSRRGGLLGLMGYNVTPDGSANAITVDRSSSNPGEGEASPTLTLGQIGSGFTWSDSFPLYLEGYIGYARYDPRTLFTGSGERQLPLRWNNVAATIGIGWDFKLTDYLVLRPTLNGSIGEAAGDAALFGALVNQRTNAD